MRRLVDYGYAAGSRSDIRSLLQMVRLEPTHGQSLHLHHIQIHARDRRENRNCKFPSRQPIPHLTRIAADDDICLRENPLDKLPPEALVIKEKTHGIPRTPKIRIVGDDLTLPLGVEQVPVRFGFSGLDELAVVADNDPSFAVSI